MKYCFINEENIITNIIECSEDVAKEINAKAIKDELNIGDEFQDYYPTQFSQEERIAALENAILFLMHNEN